MDDAGPRKRGQLRRHSSSVGEPAGVVGGGWGPVSLGAGVGSADGGSLDEEFTITIGGSGETVQFKALGKVVPSTAATTPSAN